MRGARATLALTRRRRAFSLPKWTIVAHALLWFFGMTALWIADVRRLRASLAVRKKSD